MAPKLHFQVASVANDFLPSNGILSRLYATDQVAKFIQDILQLERIFRVVDPIACMFVNLAQPGWPTVDPWHFDESPFAATILLQKPDQCKIVILVQFKFFSFIQFSPIFSFLSILFLSFYLIREDQL